MILLNSLEFGRRVRDNGSGGVAFVLGEKVKGSHYGQMLWLKPSIWFRAISIRTWTSAASTRLSLTKYRENQADRSA